MTYLISPTEPKQLQKIGTVSSVPESYGCDVFWLSKLGKIGVQRKEFRDFINSVRSDRLGREVSKMKQLDIGIVIVEGNVQWANGQSLAVPGWSEVQHMGVCFSLMLEGFWVLSSTGLSDTIELVSLLQRWTMKKDHTSLKIRPNPVSQWGKANNKDWGVHLLQSFEGISHKRAGMIYDHFGGVPLIWTVDEFDLMQVDGIGAVLAVRLMGALSGGSGSESVDKESD